MPRVLRHAFVGAAMLLVAIAPGIARADGTWSCEGFAPTVTSCSTGTRTRADGLAQDVNADFGYVGTVESSLVWSGGARAYRCTFVPDQPTTCLGSGSFPPVGTSFTHRCRSIVPDSASTVAPGAAGPGVEGGAGTWQCSVTLYTTV